MWEDGFTTMRRLLEVGLQISRCNCLHMPTSICFFNIPNFQFLTKSKLSTEVVKKLIENKTAIVYVCVDNSRYNIKALKGQIDSSQELSGKSFMRMPCAAHTANLAIKDFFNDIEFHFVCYEIEYLPNHKPEKSIQNGFSPKLITER